MELGEILTHALTYSVIAFALNLAFRPGEILDIWPILVDKWSNILPYRIRDYVKKPLYDCMTCMAGQMALWAGVVNWWNAPELIATVAYTIFIAWLIGKIENILNLWI